MNVVPNVVPNAVSHVVPRGIYRIQLTRELCKACGLCVAWCPQQVLAADEQAYPVVVKLEACVDCKACERHCPDFAIEVIRPQRQTRAAHSPPSLGAADTRPAATP